MEEANTHATPEMALLIAKVVDAEKKGKNALRAIRRKIRYRLFRIRDGQLGEYDQGLKKWIELQFVGEMNWPDFTFGWDVSCQDPLRVITKFEWDGKVMDGHCDPPAFTKQE